MSATRRVSKANVLQYGVPAGLSSHILQGESRKLQAKVEVALLVVAYA